ncbi:hypothetical protein AM233_20015 [Bacillus sp. FJAT-22058]|nr:hypothetical protein AM233_20015 [Bacillus sp. FJAT-22058]
MKNFVKYRNIIYACLMAFYFYLTWSQAFTCAFFGAYFFPRVIQQIMRRINFVEKPLMIEKDLLVREEDNG